MPLAGQRLEVCAQGVRGDAVFPGLKQTVAWQRRPDKADASCVAVWPKEAGWLKVEAQGAKPVAHAVYVYDEDDWPLWQKAQRRDATARYAARTPAPQAAGSTPLPAWPFALLFTAGDARALVARAAVRLRTPSRPARTSERPLTPIGQVSQQCVKPSCGNGAGLRLVPLGRVGVEHIVRRRPTRSARLVNA